MAGKFLTSDVLKLNPPELVAHLSLHRNELHSLKPKIAESWSMCELMVKVHFVKFYSNDL